MDRIDLHLDVRRIPPGRVLEAGRGTSSAQLREAVVRGRAFAAWRRAQEDAVGAHGSRSPLETCALADGARQFLVSVAELRAMSGRAMVRTALVARTIADMAESSEVLEEHVAEALNFRVREGVGGS